MKLRMYDCMGSKKGYIFCRRPQSHKYTSIRELLDEKVVMEKSLLRARVYFEQFLKLCQKSNFELDFEAFKFNIPLLLTGPYERFRLVSKNDQLQRTVLCNSRITKYGREYHPRIFANRTRYCGNENFVVSTLFCSSK